MGLFFNEVKKAAPQRAASRRRDIPIQSLNRLGCSVCPRDKVDLTSPKMEPQGSPGAKLYILTSAPSKTDDEKGQWMTGRRSTTERTLELVQALDRVRRSGSARASNPTP